MLYIYVCMCARVCVCVCVCMCVLTINGEADVLDLRSYASILHRNRILF